MNWLLWIEPTPLSLYRAICCGVGASLALIVNEGVTLKGCASAEIRLARV